MPIFTAERALRDLPKTPVILNAILKRVDQAWAEQATDGPDGWSVLEIVGHLNEYEAIFIERVTSIVENDEPTLLSYNQEELAKVNRYAEQQLEKVFASYISRRRAFLAYLRGLTAEQWQRCGQHPAWGRVSVIELAFNATLHDVNHIEQIIKALRLS